MSDIIAKYTFSKEIFPRIGEGDCVDTIDSDITFKNSLVWFMAEETARELCEKPY